MFLNVFGFSPGAFTLMYLRIVTGRQHQIRCHLAHVGHPVVCEALLKQASFQLSFFSCSVIKICNSSSTELILDSQGLPSTASGWLVQQLWDFPVRLWLVSPKLAAPMAPDLSP